MFLTIEQLKAQTPSQRLQFALDAVEEMEQSPFYQFDIGSYHSYSEKRKMCFACVGGAAAIKAIKGNFNEPVYWGSLKPVRQIDVFFQDFEYSLDEAATGQIDCYLDRFGIQINTKSWDDRELYFDSAEYFKNRLSNMIKYLKEREL